MSTRTGEGAVAFTDIVGFTEFTADRGDAGALVVLDAQDRIVRAALPTGARIVKELGDGLMLWFPEAAAGLAACLDLREEFEAATTDDLPLWVRMGMHWGCPTARGEDLVGHDVNIAARIVDVAGPGELLVSEHLCTAIDDEVPGLELEELGPVVMKGIPDPVGLFRATKRAR
ncbi:MAG TPA: adenylate/guanylate cyclase domain-containing protein [Acidimicrobiia bacterium]